MSDADSESSDTEIRKINKRRSSESSFEDGTAEEDIETLVQAKTQEIEVMTSSPAQEPRRKRFIPKYEVDGVLKIILGNETQTLIELCVGNHVNSQFPWKLVNKAKIIESIEVGQELSEFFAFKEEINEYPDDMILMGYIPDESRDYDEFYLCYTVEARDHCKQQSDRFIKRQEKKLLKTIFKKPRQWKSLGSEAEIIELIPVNTRPLIEVEVKSKYPTSYQPQCFVVRDTDVVKDGYVELVPYRAKFSNVHKKRIDCAIQVAPSALNQLVQTDLKYPKNMWTQSIVDELQNVTEIDTGAAGDLGNIERQAKDTHSSDEEEGMKKKTIEDDPGVLKFKTGLKKSRRPSQIIKVNQFVETTKTEVDDVVELNTVMDMYCNDYPKLVAKEVLDIYDSMAFEEYVCFSDVRAKDKYVSCAAFHPMWSGIVAISYSDSSPSVMITRSNRVDPNKRAVYGLNPVMIWSHIDSLLPKLYLETPREVKVLSFCPFDENLLLGGCINGQIAIWDLTNKLENVEKIEVLSETLEKYRRAMNAHMGWMKNVENNSVVQMTALSNLLTSHYGAITTLKWLSPNFYVTRTGNNAMMENNKKSIFVFSGSVDGNILIWNLSIENITVVDDKSVKKSKRVLKRPSGLLVDISPLRVFDQKLNPTFKVILGRADNPGTIPIQNFDMRGPIVNYTYNPRNNRTGRKYFSCEIVQQSEDDICKILYCGSVHGALARISWKGHDFNSGELVGSAFCELQYQCKIHDGLITRVAINPFLSDFTMTVGGKVIAFWSDRLKERPFSWKKRHCRLTDAAWSTYKPSLFFVTTSDGTIEAWDLLLRSDKPVSVQTLSGTMLTGISLHLLPIPTNITGVSDLNGAFRMFLNPPIFMIHHKKYFTRMNFMLERELNVMKSFQKWQDNWRINNPQIFLERKKKEAEFMAEREEKKRREKEKQEKEEEEKAEARRLAKLKVVGPKERWQKIINKLIEKTIAAKKKINRAELIENERPLRELEAQRLEKEKRLLEIMKSQKTIFNDTVAILFPEAVQKEEKVKQSTLSSDKNVKKKEFLDDYDILKLNSIKMIRENSYVTTFAWEDSITDGKERRQSLTTHEYYIKMHKKRIKGETINKITSIPKSEVQEEVTVD